MNKTFVMIKPDGVSRKLIGKIINRFEKENFQIIAMKMFQVSKELAEIHYAEHKGKSFYEKLISFITSGPIVAMVLKSDDNIVKKVREIVGATNPAEALPGTIRGDFKEIPVKSVTENMIHASDSKESAKREINLFF
ncbi:MAG: nucleoside-diphosphate kinase, partial [Promethearchaeota archaeon]